jgi:ketosteroid isomerase-like protein
MITHRPIPLSCVLAIVLLLPLRLRAQASSSSAAVESLVAAERAFAATSVDRGIRDAFLANLGDSAVIFRPGPVAGRQWFGTHAGSRAHLNWEPRYAEVSASGELGFTTGPFELRPQGPDTTPVYGHYVTMWSRGAGGTGAWKVALDIGIGHRAVASDSLTVRSGRSTAFADAAGQRAALLRTDSSLGATPAMLATLLANRLAADARLYRDGGPPVVGQGAVRGALASDKRLYGSAPLGGGVADAGDFGYTWGSYTLTAPSGAQAGDEHGYYLRIWRREGGGQWRIVLDLTNAQS